ncbi:hypothetical protein [Halomarina oriensis]|uniref:Uncharacterized protein n=1 Tax=Halomarina oriensis TaxID=671145 RepID=A0A6B0GFG1_9EURY|nr:hypothetical protein [Halomarina oriensis]MWG33250.1 hypothetical protein [Halomarina oriensis]
MTLGDLLSNGTTRTTSALSMLFEAALALSRGKRRIAALFVLAAVVAYRFSWVGFALQIAIRLYDRSR